MYEQYWQFTHRPFDELCEPPVFFEAAAHQAGALLPPPNGVLTMRLVDTLVVTAQK